MIAGWIYFVPMDCTDTESAYSMDIDFFPTSSLKEPSSAHFASAVDVRGFDSQEEVDRTELEPTFSLLRLQLSEAVIIIIVHASHDDASQRNYMRIMQASRCGVLAVMIIQVVR